MAAAATLPPLLSFTLQLSQTCSSSSLVPGMRLQNLAKFSRQTLWESSEGMQQQLGKVWKMGPLQKGYEKRFAVEEGELKHINRKGCFKHSESAGKRGKNNTNIKYKSNVGWIFTVLVVVKVIVRVFWDHSWTPETWWRLPPGRGFVHGEGADDFPSVWTCRWWNVNYSGLLRWL